MAPAGVGMSARRPRRASNRAPTAPALAPARRHLTRQRAAVPGQPQASARAGPHTVTSARTPAGAAWATTAPGIRVPVRLLSSGTRDAVEPVQHARYCPESSTGRRAAGSVSAPGRAEQAGDFGDGSSGQVPLTGSVVTLTAPELNADQMIGATEVATIAGPGVRASSVRAVGTGRYRGELAGSGRVCRPPGGVSAAAARGAAGPSPAGGSAMMAMLRAADERRGP